MQLEKDGGPAFPHTDYDDELDANVARSGMSLRDWFAGRAMAGLITRPPNDDRLAHLMPWDAASLAYEYADAMLAERDRVAANAKLDGAADEMLAALKNLENDDGAIPAHAWALVQDAIAKAEGRADG